MSPSPRAGRVSNTPRVTISGLNPHPATPSSTGISQTHPTDVRWWITGGVGASHQWWQRGVLFIGVCKKKITLKIHVVRASLFASCESHPAAPRELWARGKKLRAPFCNSGNVREKRNWFLLSHWKKKIISLLSAFHNASSTSLFLRLQIKVFSYREKCRVQHITIQCNRETGSITKPWAACRAFSIGQGKLFEKLLSLLQH